MKFPPLDILDYSYNLPESRIAAYPLAERDKARLLVYEGNRIVHRSFAQLADLLTDNSVLYFNDTKVIPARFFFEKTTGASIEVLLLQPMLPSTLLASAMAASDKVTWKCTVGNLKKWGDGLLLQKQITDTTLIARLADRKEGLIEFAWRPSNLSFAEVLQKFGSVPLPPYIKRKAVDADRTGYQTVYAHFDGAVAAPTAGLHFTENVLEKLKSKKIIMDYLTLHVSAGTFLPVKTSNAREHLMHAEQIVVRRRNLENLMLANKKIIAVGTTSLRTLESIYWYGLKLLDDPHASFVIDQYFPDRFGDDLPAPEVSFKEVLHLMDKMKTDELVGQTSIYIFPSYRFRVCRGLLTNFHQPGSTLMLLVAAFVGPDWKKIYQAALENDYRFLSYGDTSLLLP